MGSTEITRTASPERRLASVAVKVAEYSPEMVGVPLRVPSGASRSPGGTAPPVTAHEYGPSPRWR